VALRIPLVNVVPRLSPFVPFAQKVYIRVD